MYLYDYIPTTNSIKSSILGFDQNRETITPTAKLK